MKRTTKSITPPVASQEAITEVSTPNLSSYEYLSLEQLEKLSMLHEFPVDVHTLPVAKMLRDIERDQAFFGHTLIEIGKVLGDYGVHEPHPYFSVNLGADGLEFKNGKL